MARVTRPNVGANAGRRGWLVWALLAASVCLPPSASPQSVPSSSRPLLIVGNDDYAPLSYLENGQPKGLDVEVAMAIGRAMGREIRIELMPWERARQRVLQGDADALIDLALGSERDDQWDFTAPILGHDFRLVVRDTEVAIRGVNDLSGRRVGAAAGGLAFERLRLQSGVTLVPISGYLDAVQRLKAGEFDALAGDNWVLAYTIQKNSVTGVAFAGAPFITRSSGLAVRKGNLALIAEMNPAIRALTGDGTFERIQDGWRPQEVVFVSRQQIERIVILAVGLVLVGVVAAMVLWVRTLKRQMRVRREAEARTREAQERLGVALESAEMGTWRWVAATGEGTRDAQLNVILGRGAAGSTHALDDWFGSVHPDDLAETKKQFERATQEHTPFDSEFRIVRPDGEVRWLRGKGRTFYTPAGDLDYVTGAVVDITTRKTAEAAARISEERFQKAFELSPDCIAISDFNGIVEINQRFEELTGYRREEIIGRNIAEFGLMEDSSQRAVFLQRIRETGSLSDFLLRYRRKDGAIGTAVLAGQAMEIEGRPGFLTVARDITHQRELEASLQRASEINRLFVSELEPQSLYAAITESLNGVVSVDFASLVLLDRTSGELEVRAQTFYDGRGIVATRQAVAATRVLAEAALKRGDVSIFRQAELEAFGPVVTPVLAEGLQTVCGVPLGGRRGPLGVLEVGSRRDGAFSEHDVTVLRQLSTYVGIAIENAQTYEEVTELKNRLNEEKLYLEEEIRVDHNFADIVGNTSTLRRVLQQIQTVAATESTVLLLGETGTGKELLARAVHNLSPRKDRTFVRLNAAALPGTLLESELFGYERGAFTGAVGSKVGRFELAHRGTLFLDEVGDIPLELQPKLLRVLQEREFERLGSTRTQRVDVRLIAATNRDLEVMSGEGSFRSDLYHRLNVFPIRIPPLRERRDDIPLLVRHFVQHFAAKLKRQVTTIPASTMSALQDWHWPGNIRELENVIERAVILTPGDVLQVPLAELRPPNVVMPPRAEPEPQAGGVTFADSEREMILRALRETNGIIAGDDGAAARLGLKRTTLQSKMRKLGIRRPSF